MTLLAKAMFNLDGALSVLSPELDPVRLIEEYMITIKTMRLQAQATSPANLAWALDLWRLWEDAPRQSRAILDKLATDRLRLHAELNFSDNAARRLNRLSNSILVGAALVAAGYVMGSMLRRRE